MSALFINVKNVFINLNAYLYLFIFKKKQDQYTFKNCIKKLSFIKTLILTIPFVHKNEEVSYLIFIVFVK